MHKRARANLVLRVASVGARLQSQKVRGEKGRYIATRARTAVSSTTTPIPAAAAAVAAASARVMRAQIRDQHAREQKRALHGVRHLVARGLEVVRAAGHCCAQFGGGKAANVVDGRRRVEAVRVHERRVLERGEYLFKLGIVARREDESEAARRVFGKGEKGIQKGRGDRGIELVWRGEGDGAHANTTEKTRGRKKV